MGLNQGFLMNSMKVEVSSPSQIVCWTGPLHDYGLILLFLNFVLDAQNVFIFYHCGSLLRFFMFRPFIFIDEVITVTTTYTHL